MKFQWTYKHKPWRALDISMYKMAKDFKKTKQTSEYTQRSMLSGRVHIFPAFFQKAFLKLLKLDKYQWGITYSVNRNEQNYKKKIQIILLCFALLYISILFSFKLSFLFY